MVESARKAAIAKPSREVPAFEVRLSADPRWALSEGSLFFEGKGAVQEALRRITSRLNELHIPYAVAGGWRSLSTVTGASPKTSTFL